jgi:hypothetical protein
MMRRLTEFYGLFGNVWKLGCSVFGAIRSLYEREILAVVSIYGVTMTMMTMGSVYSSYRVPEQRG